MNIFTCIARDLPDLWFQLLAGINEHGRRFIVDKGSYEGETRLEFDFVLAEITHPTTEPLLPDIPPAIGIPNPVEHQYIYGGPDYERSYIEYLMTAEKAPNESYCYDDQTEILTDKGWKFFKDLLHTDKVATLDGAGVLGYQTPINHHSFEYNDDMFYLKSKQIDLAITKKHTCYVSNTRIRQPSFDLVKIEDIKDWSRIRFKKNAVWNGDDSAYFEIPGTIYYNRYKERSNKIRKIPMDAWLKFFGVWLADGSLRRSKKNSYCIVITKYPGEVRDEIIKVLEGIFSTVTIYGKDILINDKQIYTYLMQFGKAGDKYIPRNILNLNSENLLILFDWMYMCDGNKGENYTRYSTKSNKLADDVQELLLKIGLCGTISKDSGVYRITVGSNRHKSMNHVTPCISKNNISTKKYNGMVYCVEVRHFHTLYVRRKGKVCWCGNTYGERLTKTHIHGYDYDHLKYRNHLSDTPTDQNILTAIDAGYYLNQIELLIDTYKKHGYRNNQMTLQIAQPSDMLLLDPPCLRHIDTRIQDNGNGPELSFHIYFRSWELWNGLPANLAGIVNVARYIAGELDIPDENIKNFTISSKGLHLYGYAEELAKLRCMK